MWYPVQQIQLCILDQQQSDNSREALVLLSQEKALKRVARRAWRNDVVGRGQAPASDTAGRGRVCGGDPQSDGRQRRRNADANDIESPNSPVAGF
jgi:hypothetical protein